MRYTLINKKIGVGLAAPQINRNLALSVICIRPTKHRPSAKEFDLVIINPEIVEIYGEPSPMWEGCLSAGEGGLFAMVPRYKKVKLRYIDENALLHERTFTGLQAQVVQHETDHLNGILFMSRVKDPKTYMTLKEYKKRILGKLVKDANGLKD